MENGNPKLIVTLEAVDITAERAWGQSYNRDRYLPAGSHNNKVNEYSSREHTRSPSVSSGSCLQLTFDERPKNIKHGFVFGSDPRICDVLLGGKADGFSGRHFYISFNERGEVTLKNLSNRVASISYNGEKAPERTHFTWILFETYENIIITMAKRNLKFKVVWPKRNQECEDMYKAHRNRYLEETRDEMPSFDQLDVQSQQTTAQVTQHHSPRQQPVYLLETELGSGTFGTVYKTVDVSTGYQYAAKEFYGFDWKREVEIFRLISHVSTNIVDDEPFI